MKWNFQGWWRKNNVEFPGVFVFGLGISNSPRDLTQSCGISSGVELCLEFPEVKKWKIPGGLPPPPIWTAKAIVKTIARTKMYIKSVASYLSWWRNKVSVKGIYWYSKATHIQNWNAELWFSYSKDCLVTEKKIKKKVWKFWYRTISSTIVGYRNCIEFPSILNTLKMISLKKQLLKLA